MNYELEIEMLSLAFELEIEMMPAQTIVIGGDEEISKSFVFAMATAL